MKLPRLDGSILHSKVLQGVLLFFAVATSFVILLHMPLVRVASSDLFLYFRPAARAWPFGGEAYGIHGYVNPPWTLPLMVPFSLGPPRLGYVLFFLFSCAVVAAAVRAFGGRAWTLLAVLIAPPTVALLALGQVDIWVLLGVILGRWAADEEYWAGLGLALALLLIKPQIGALMALTWILTLPKCLTWKALVALGVVWFLSCLTVGTWWPFEVNFTRELDGSYRRSTLSTLSAVRGLGLPSFVYAVLVAGLLGLWGWEIRVQRSSDYLIALSLLVGSLCSPFILLHSFSVSLAVAFVYVASRSWLWAVPCYVLTWVPILTLWVDDWQSWWGAGAWWVLLVALLVVRRHLAEE